jgi:hypothetical protein
MSDQGPIDFLPLWAFFALTIVIVMGSLEAGFFLGKRRAAGGDHEKESSAGAMANASLALLAFLLAFTFGFAANRFEARRSVLIQEVNSIGTTYLRTATLPEAERARPRALLREYVDTRLAGARTSEVDAAIRHSVEIQNQLWDHAAALAERSPGSIVLGLYLQTLNEMIDLHTKRVTDSLRVRVPAIVWLVLYAVTVLAMGEMGYQTGLGGRRRPLTTPAFALAFSVVMLLIADLDRPQAGAIRVSQQSMIELRESMTEPAP